MGILGQNTSLKKTSSTSDFPAGSGAKHLPPNAPPPPVLLAFCPSSPNLSRLKLKKSSPANKMDTIETFNFKELKACSVFTNGMIKYREIQFEYKGGKPVFRVDGNIYYLLYSNRWEDTNNHKISIFREKLSNELFKAVGKEITDDYKDEFGLVIDEVSTN